MLNCPARGHHRSASPTTSTAKSPTHNSAPTPQYNNGETLVLALTIKPLDSGTNNGEPMIQLYAIGKGYVVKERGARVEHESSNPEKSFNKSSSVWSLYQSLIDNLSRAELMQIVGRGDPIQAKTLEGLTFHWKQVAFKSLGGAEKSRLLPVALIDGGKSGGKSSNGKGSGGASANAIVALAAKPKLFAKLRAIALAASDNDQFVDDVASGLTVEQLATVNTATGSEDEGEWAMSTDLFDALRAYTDDDEDDDE
jgi:hypothetical protein